MAKKKKKVVEPKMLEAICPKCEGYHLWDPELWKTYGENLTRCIFLKSYDVDKYNKYISLEPCGASLKKFTKQV